MIASMHHCACVGPRDGISAHSLECVGFGVCFTRQEQSNAAPVSRGVNNIHPDNTK